MIMGYAFGKTGLHTQDSDMAYDLHIEVQEAIVKILRKAEKVIENEFNTDGVLNVGMILQDLQPICNGDDVDVDDIGSDCICIAEDQVVQVNVNTIGIALLNLVNLVGKGSASLLENLNREV